MRAHEIVARLETFRARGAGTDAERRAANWLAQELASAGTHVTIEPFWCRPNWALAHAWHVAIAIAGSLVSVSQPTVGAVLIAIALISVATDATLGLSLGRRLTRERASQNVVLRPSRGADPDPLRLRLLITANYDAGRTGLVYRDAPRAAAARLRSGLGASTPGWLGWLAIALMWLIAVAILRAGNHHSTALAIAQFLPTALLVLTGAALLELAVADFGPAANDNGSGTAIAVALVRALTAAPPHQIDVELVLQGAGDGGGIGLRRHLRRRSAPTAGPRLRRPPRVLNRTNAAVLGIASCGAGDLHYWTSDGPLLPLPYSKRLRQLAAELPDMTGPRPFRGRGSGPAFPARLTGIPAITLGGLDGDGRTPRSHQSGDVAAEVDPATLDAMLERTLILIDALDAFLAQTPPPPTPPPPAAQTPPHATTGAATRATDP